MKSFKSLAFVLCGIVFLSACSSSSSKSVADSEIYVEIAKEYWAAGESEKSLRELENAIKAHPKNLGAHFLKMEILATLERFDEASLAAGEGEKYLDEKTAYLKDYWLGVINYHRKDYEKAIENLQNSSKLKKDFNDSFTLLGQLYTITKDREKAVESYRRSSEIQPENPKSWTDLGISLVRAKKYDEAKKALDKAISINPKDYFAHNYLGRWAEEQGKLKEAEEYYIKSLEINDSNPFTNLNLGQLLMNQKRHREAYKYLLRSSELQPELIFPYFWLGVFYQREKDFEKSYEYFTKVLAIDDRFTQARISIADAALEAGSGFSRAVQEMEKGLELDKNNARSYLYYLARLKLAMNDPQGALDNLSKSAALLSPAEAVGLADVYLLKGRIMDSMGKPSQAREEYEKVVELLPGSEVAAEAREYIKN